ncbi:MAG TPA: hypothetical protein VIJ75_21225 [Hanamia sp.]
MKTITTLPTVQLDKYGQQNRLVQEANVNDNGQKRNFTTVDMWNRNRKVHPASSKVRRWNFN